MFSFVSYALLWSMFSLAIPGIILNLFVCVLSFHPLVIGDYKWFILHLSVMDIIYSISNLSFSGFMLFPGSYEGIFCKISAFLHWYCIMMSIFSLIPITFNRLCSLFYPKIYSVISKPVGILVTIFLCDITVFLLLIPYPTLVSRIIRGNTGSCDFEVSEEPVGMIYGAVLLLESPAIFGILAYMNLRIFLIVRTRKKYSHSFEEEQKNAVLKETNSIMRATVLQAAVPMVVQVPMLVITGFFIARRSVAVELEHFSIFLHSINPIANVLVTFIVVKAYNRALRSKLGMVAPADATTIMVNRRREHVKFAALVRLNQQFMKSAQLAANLQKRIIDGVEYPVRNTLTTVL